MQAETAGKRQGDKSDSKPAAAAAATASAASAAAAAAAAAAPDKKATAKTSEPTKDERKCWRCQEKGHIAPDCPNLKKVGEFAHVCEEFDYDSDSVVFETASLAVEESAAAATEEVPAIFDSACSSMMSPPTSELTDFVPRVEKINLAGKGHSITSDGRGSVGKLRDVMISKDLRQTLVSVSKLDREGKFTIFGNGKAYVVDQVPTMHGNVFLSGTLGTNNLYQADVTAVVPPEPIAAAAVAAPVIHKPCSAADRREVRDSFGLLRTRGTSLLNQKQVFNRRLGRFDKRETQNLFRHDAVLGVGTTRKAVSHGGTKTLFEKLTQVTAEERTGEGARWRARWSERAQPGVAERPPLSMVWRMGKLTSDDDGLAGDDGTGGGDDSDGESEGKPKPVAMVKIDAAPSATAAAASGPECGSWSADVRGAGVVRTEIVVGDAMMANRPLPHMVNFREPVKHDQEPTLEPEGKATVKVKVPGGNSNLLTKLTPADVIQQYRATICDTVK